MKSNCFHIRGAVAHLEPSQTSKMEHFAKIVNIFKPLTIFAKTTILDVWLGSVYVSRVNTSEPMSLLNILIKRRMLIV